MGWRENRAAWLEVPGVAALPEPAQCTGWHSASGGKRPCKLPALWHFESQVTLDEFSGGNTGDYCRNHLWSRGVIGDMSEEAVFKTWLQKHPEWTRWIQA